jgi:lipoyl(octanoyl) transferase
MSLILMPSDIASDQGSYAKGVTIHGFALNVNPDLSWFDRIVPCGLADATATSMTVELGRNITVEEVVPVVERHVYEALARVSA